MQLQLASGKDSITVDPGVFGKDFNEGLVHQITTAHLAGARAGTKRQKNRSDVSGGGAKPWRQKGTGRARAGTIRSPIWTGGGVTFAARPQDHSQKVNKKMYRGAMQSILSELVRSGTLKVVNDFTVESPKTKLLIQKLNEMGETDVLVVTDAFDQNLFLAARNIPNVYAAEPADINPVRLLKHKSVVITVAALRQLEEKFK